MTRKGMMKNIGYLPILLWIVLSLFFAAQVRAEGTAAGTLIQNQATATYVDVNDNSFTAQSNVATITVKAIYSAEISQDREKIAAAGNTVNFSHTVKNTGNSDDVYTVTIAEGITGGDDIDFGTLKIFLDADNNGQVDAGETEIPSGSTITISPDQQNNLVVQATVPGSATPGQTVGATLTVTSANATVTDLTTGKGLDTLDETNEDKVTVTGDAVLNVTKSSTYNDLDTENDISDDTITYTVTIKNTGSRDAKDVNIYDVLDLTKFAIDSVDKIVMGTVNGISETGDTTPAPNDDADGNGNIGIKGLDAVLGIGVTVSFTYTVPVKADLPAGTVIENTVNVKGDTNDDNDSDDPGEDIDSNTTMDTVPQTYGVSIADTGTGGDPNNNDGGDDDNNGDDTQTVNTVQSGDTVIFTNVITNTGSGEDTFQLTVPNPGEPGNDFPVGTVFTFWHAGGATALLDTDNDGKIDTGPMDAEEITNIIIKAKLPPDAYDNDGTHTGPYDATITATSAGNDTIDDDVHEKVSTIQAPKVDLSNSTGKKIDSADNDSGTNQHEYSANSDPVTTVTGAIGDTVPIFLTVQNDSGISDSFQFSIGSTYDGTTLGTLPEGWSYVFHDENDNIISGSPALAPGASFKFHAEVIISGEPTEALADFLSDYDSDGTDEKVDNNNGDGTGDNDGDYPIFVMVKSVNTSAVDIKMDAIDITDSEDISLISNQSGQIEPGGSITYDHTLRNDGNTVEILKLEGTNALSGDSWTNSILVDTTGNKTPDKPFNALVDGSDPVYYYDTDGNYVAQNFGGSTLPNSGNAIVLDSGERLVFQARVYAPSSAPDGTIDTLLVKATYNDGSSKVENTDQTTVQKGQLRITKTVALDDGCDFTPDEAFAPTAISDVEPEKCVIWQMIITNEGTAPASKVKISDTIPVYSTYMPESLKSGAGDAGLAVTPAITLYGNTDADDDESANNDGYSAKVSGNDIIYYIGTGASQSEGGALAPGASITTRFSTKVE